MRSKTLKKLFSVVLSVIVICCLAIFLYIKNKNLVVKSDLINKANNIINENIVSSAYSEKTSEEQLAEECEAFSVEKISEDNNVLGKIKIPSINVEAPIKEGTSAKILKESVGHFTDTSYWNGNVCLASHNRGTYAHYFEKINELKINDEIVYQTKLGTRIYVINEINQISENDTSVLDNTKQNTITLITCIKNKKELRLCVKATEKV